MATSPIWPSRNLGNSSGKSFLHVSTFCFLFGRSSMLVERFDRRPTGAGEEQLSSDAGPQELQRWRCLTPPTPHLFMNASHRTPHLGSRPEATAPKQLRSCMPTDPGDEQRAGAVIAPLVERTVRGVGCRCGRVLPESRPHVARAGADAVALGPRARSAAVQLRAVDGGPGCSRAGVPVLLPRQIWPGPPQPSLPRAPISSATCAQPRRHGVD